MITSVKNKLLAVCVAIGCCHLVGCASFLSMFDRTQVVSRKGIVREFQWTNPHSWVQLMVKDPGGEVQEWSLEALSPNVLGAWVWKRNSLKPGDEITAYFNPTRDGTHGGNLVKVMLSDVPSSEVSNEAPQRHGARARAEHLPLLSGPRLRRRRRNIRSCRRVRNVCTTASSTGPAFGSR